MFNLTDAAYLLREFVSRRGFLAAATFSAAAAGFPGPAAAQTPAGVRKGEHDASATDPGPENNPLRAINPNVFNPPATDQGLTPAFWNSFSAAHRRVQEGGWSRQVNVETFPISTEIAGVNMRPGDVGYVPKTLGHYVENTGSTDLVFLEMFKTPRYQDLSLNDWMTHIPPELVMEHLGISPQTLAAIPKANLAILPA